VTVRNGDEDGDPGQIIEAKFVVEDGAVVLRDTGGKFITSRMLLKDENPGHLQRFYCASASQTSFRNPSTIQSWGWRDRPSLWPAGCGRMGRGRRQSPLDMAMPLRLRPHRRGSRD
jgi:hypothetical protein